MINKIRKKISRFLRKSFLKNLFEYFHLHSRIRNELANCKTLLDIGCGVYDFRDPITKEKTFKSTGIDIFEPSIEKSKSLNIHNDYVLGDVMNLEKYFSEKSFDAVTALDLIEHLEKDDGLNLLNKMENIAIKKIILFTPNGFFRQGEEYGNPFQTHRSGWYVDEMRSRGYKVFGFGGLKFLNKQKQSNSKIINIINLILISFSQIFVINNPKIAFSILCVKDFEWMKKAQTQFR